MEEKNLAYYKALTYPAEVVREDGVVVAFHPDLEGCVAQGDTADEALANLDEAREAWLRVRLEERLPIPEPQDEEYSGRYLLRMTPVLHAALARRARRQGVSLSHLIVTVLSEYIGIAQTRDEHDEVLNAIRGELARMAAQLQAPTIQRGFSGTSSSSLRLRSPQLLVGAMGRRQEA